VTHRHMIAELTLVLAFAGQPPAVGQSRPMKPALCNFAKVYHLKGGSKLNVRSGYGVRFSLIDKLPEDAVVYTYDERGDWDEVMYGRSGKPCTSGTLNGLPETQTEDCQSGWVRKDWIDVLSG
jgi:hypothetical protein